MSTKGQYKSAASCRGRSAVQVQRIYPRQSDHATVGVTMSVGEIPSLVRQLMDLFTDADVYDHVILTAHRKQLRMTVLARTCNNAQGESSISSNP